MVACDAAVTKEQVHAYPMPQTELVTYVASVPRVTDPKCLGSCLGLLRLDDDSTLHKTRADAALRAFPSLSRIFPSPLFSRRVSPTSQH